MQALQKEEHGITTRDEWDLWSSLDPRRVQALQKEERGLEIRASNTNPSIWDGEENPETWKGYENADLRHLSKASSIEYHVTGNNSMSACAGFEVSWFEAYVLSLFDAAKGNKEIIKVPKRKQIAQGLCFGSSFDPNSCSWSHTHTLHTQDAVCGGRYQWSNCKLRLDIMGWLLSNESRFKQSIITVTRNDHISASSFDQMYLESPRNVCGTKQTFSTVARNNHISCSSCPQICGSKEAGSTVVRNDQMPWSSLLKADLNSSSKIWVSPWNPLVSKWS